MRRSRPTITVISAAATSTQISRVLLLILTCLLAFVAPSSGQATSGALNFTGADTHTYDDINLISNTINIHVPVRNKAGAMPFNVQLSASSGMSTYVSNGTTYWDPMMGTLSPTYPNFPGYPWKRLVNGIFLEELPYSGALVYATVATNSFVCNNTVTNKWSGWQISLGPGIVHKLDPNLYITAASGGNCISSFTGTTTDASGWSAAVTFGQPSTLSRADGMIISVPSYPNTVQITDAFGNTITSNVVANSSKSTYYTDSMGLTALEWYNGAQFSWTDPVGGIYDKPLFQYWYQAPALTVKTTFNCGIGYPADINGVGDGNFPSQLTFPNNTYLTFSYESQISGSVTGRLSQVTTPEGETITYGYSGGNSGMDCARQTPPTLTRTINGTDTTKYTLTYGQVGTSANYYAVNTVTSPGGNQTEYIFTGFTSTGLSQTNAQVLTAVGVFQGTVGASPLSQSIYCYNQSFSVCSGSLSAQETAVVQYPITSRVVFTNIQGRSDWQATEEHYDPYGNVIYTAFYDYGHSSPDNETIVTMGTWNGTQCVGLANTNIHTTPCEVISKTSGIEVSDVRNTYSGSGSLLKTSKCVDCANRQWDIGNTTLNVYNSNGTISKSYDMNNNETDYSYLSSSYSNCTDPYGHTCAQYPFPTQIVDVNTGNYTAFTYYGTGGVLHTVSDRNGNSVATYSYTKGSAVDIYWRALQVVSASGATIDNTYPVGGNLTRQSSSYMDSGLNAGQSIIGSATTVDTSIRPYLIQIPQSPNSTTYDTYTTTYSWSGQYARTSSNTTPCSSTLGVPCASTPYTVDRDALGRVYAASHGAGYETVQHTYSGLDDLSQITPPSSGENAQKAVREYDGLGRLRISCPIYTSINGGAALTSCGVSSGSYTGIATNYAYGAVSPQGGPIQSYTYADRNDGTHDQHVYYAYDGVGRLVTEEPTYGPFVYYYYDTQTAWCPGSVANVGRLVCKKDGIYQTIYLYDSEGRLTDTGTSLSGTGATTFCRRFRYDNTTGILGSIPAGVTLSNQYGRLAEAETDDCTWPVTAAHQITDEWFAYDAAGNVTDTWQVSPHSTQYYHSHATFFENGTPKTVQLASPAFYTITFGIDGEARLYSLADTTHSKTIVNSATYFPVANPAGTTIYGSDSDSFTYDPVSGNMTQYQYKVNGVNYTGALTWNPNGTLRKLATTDGFNAAGTQTCYFNPSDAPSTGYDDFDQLVGFDCGGTNWGQTFSYDTFDNITKSKMTGRTGTSWNPGYNLSNNHYNVGSYDANGDVTSDGNFNYGWNEVGKMKWAAPSGTPTCGTSGRCITYDALGRIVETSNGSTWTERWYTQAGWASMSGTTINFAYWPAPHGARLLENANGGTYFFMHPDWVGSTRVISSLLHGISGDIQYSPYGEVTAQFGSPINGLFKFAGMTENFYKGAMFDADNRELSTAAGRWLSPDPAHAGWNQYAYPTNPNSFVDPAGLDGCTWDDSTNTLTCGGDTSPGCVAEGTEGCIPPPCSSTPEGCTGGNPPPGTQPPPSGGGGGPGPGCDANCQQLQLAQQSAILALQDSRCSTAVADGSPQAAATLGAQNGFAPLATVNVAPVPALPGGLPKILTEGKVRWVNNQYGTPMYPAGIDVTMTINSAPGGFFGKPWLFGYTPLLTQSIGLLHDTGHAATFNGLFSSVVNDDPYTIGDIAGPAISLQNSYNIGNTCFPQGDFGGNSGPGPQSPVDIPANRRPPTSKP